MPVRPRPAIERARPKIDQRGPTECWPWTGAKNSRARGGPYGHLSRGPGMGHVYAHRLVYECEVGPIPDGFEVDHRCKNSLCCNPAHLEAVEPIVNNLRSSSPPILNMAKDECPQGHAYDEANTGFRSGKKWRYCRACARESQRAKRELGLSYPEWLASKR